MSPLRLLVGMGPNSRLRPDSMIFVKTFNLLKNIYEENDATKDNVTAGTDNLFENVPLLIISLVILSFNLLSN